MNRHFISAGRGIAVEDTGNGHRIHYTGPLETSCTYRGYFLLRSDPESDTPRIAVTDGRFAALDDAAESPAGHAVINGHALSLPAAWFSPPEGFGYVYCDFSMDPETGGIEAEYRLADEIPVPESFHLKILLGICRRDGKRLTLYQQQHGMIYGFIFLFCKDPAQELLSF